MSDREILARDFAGIMDGYQLEELCSRLGFGSPIWHRTEQFKERLNSCVNQDALEEYRHPSRPAGNGEEIPGVVTDAEAFLAVLREAEQLFQKAATRTRSRGGSTEELDTAILSIREMGALVTAQKPVGARMFSDLIGHLWYGRNWESLPDPIYERKKALDDVLWNVGLAMDRRDWALDRRARHLTEAVHGYVAHEWMRARWLSIKLAHTMLCFSMQPPLGERRKSWKRWGIGLMIAGGVLSIVPGIRVLGIGLLLMGIADELVADLWIAGTQKRVDRIVDEISSGLYSGAVLAERLERLDHYRCEVPSILTELLRTPVEPKERGELLSPYPIVPRPNAR